MNCEKTDDSAVTIKAENSVEEKTDATDWVSAFKKSTGFMADEIAKMTQRQPNQLVHDICTKDVRDFGMTTRTISQVVPCNPDGSAGCRGGSLPNGVPVVDSIRILCADESLSPATGCDRIINNVEFEVVLRYGVNTFVVLTPKETFPVFWYDFLKFPSLESFPTVEDFKQELKVIDGSCKAIAIVNATVVQEENNCVLNIVYNVFDKLWKYEDLIIFATKAISNSTVVCDVFKQGHEIGPCTSADCASCCG